MNQSAGSTITNPLPRADSGRCFLPLENFSPAPAVPSKRVVARSSDHTVQELRISASERPSEAPFAHGVIFHGPQQWQLLARDPSVASSAVSELLRFDGPVQGTVREALQDVHIGSKTKTTGYLLLGLANRDEDHFPDPDALDLRRSGVRVLSSGHGIHTWLGAVLARLEAQVSFSELARRFPNLSVEIEAPEWTPSIPFRGLGGLPIAMIRNSVT